MKLPELIGIIGATATGKTRLAVALSIEINGEIISADSRQVYREMNLGTGKDISEFTRNGQNVTYHLIDIAQPGEEYNVFRYKTDFNKAFNQVISLGKTPILCGGSGLYIETALGKNDLQEVPINFELRATLSNKPIHELVAILSSYRSLHNTTDTMDRERCLKAIEIEMFKASNHQNITLENKFDPLIFGVSFPREQLRSRITDRLNERLQDGMIEEVKYLLENGISSESLKYYGLEYKFITMYIEHEISFDEMFKLLNTSIHQFAKRQETWWRRMEKRGIQISWIEGNWNENAKLDFMLDKIKAGRKYKY